MLKNRFFLVVLALPFTVVTLYALSQVGYVGIFEYHLPSPAGWQVFLDLCVALLLVMTWMVADARKHGRTVWPYLVATLFLGSFGPLAYLIFATSDASSRQSSADYHEQSA